MNAVEREILILSEAKDHQTTSEAKDHQTTVGGGQT